MVISVIKLSIYPVKSLGGIHLDSAQLTPEGLKGDREWMLINDDGRFLTQRKYPLLATIKPQLIDGGLILSQEATGSIQVEKPTHNKRSTVFIWKDQCTALMADNKINAWIRDAAQIDIPIKLVYFDKTHRRQIDLNRFGEGHTYFSDGAPYLIANMASLDKLNTELSAEGLTPIGIDRFRANIILSGLPAFEEHRITKIQNQTLTTLFELKDHCQRCSIITINPNTGQFDPTLSPFQQLSKLNSMPNKASAPAFGVNSVLCSGNGNYIHKNECFNAT